MTEQIIRHKEEVANLTNEQQIGKNINYLVNTYEEGNMQRFAKKLLLAKTTLWDWCNGKVLPPLFRVLEICCLFDVSPVSFYIEDISVNKETVVFNAECHIRETKKKRNKI
ncbi:helix-turn-helix domain-containing protein [Bacillus cereus]